MQKAQEALAAAQAIQSIVDTAKANAEKCLADVEAVRDSLAKMITYQGSVDNYSDLPTNPQVGYSYNVKNADKEHGVNAGDNVVWNGEDWDNFGGAIDMSLFAELGKDVKFNSVTATTFTGNLIGRADMAAADANGNEFIDPQKYMHVSSLKFQSADFNDLKSTGVYMCENAVYTNTPVNSWGILRVYQIDSSSIKQEYIPYNKPEVYVRYCVAGTWDAWSKVNAGNADYATNADKVDGIHAASMFYHKGIWDANNWATIGTYQVNNNSPISGAYGWGQVISSSTPDGRFQLYASDGYGGNGRLYYRTGWDGNKNSWNTILDSENYNSFAPTKTGGGASGTWDINISGNAASATNADKVDGYHAADLLRTLGGNRTPVITDIFDRAGTIDMSTMSAANKAAHKANINKAPNMVQNLWNDAYGIYAYGGDNDMAGEYNRGTLKLTQSYKNFDKLMIIFTDDKADWELVRMFDVYEFNYYMTSLHSFTLLDNDLFWYVYGLTKQGTDASFKPSTETVLSCRRQDCGIIGIYGIKY